MGPEAKANLVPNFIRASTPELLRELMLETNLRLGMFIGYQDIQQEQSSQWIAWYYEEFNFTTLIPRHKATK